MIPGIGFAVTWESICRRCGEKNKITARWNGSTFEIEQEDKVHGNPMLCVACEKEGVPRVTR